MKLKITVESFRKDSYIKKEFTDGSKALTFRCSEKQTGAPVYWSEEMTGWSKAKIYTWLGY